MEEKLRLNDGSEIPGRAIPSGDVLYVYLDNCTMDEGYPILSDPAKTRRIEAFSYGDRTEYKGYTHLFCLREESMGVLSAGLRKEEANG